VLAAVFLMGDERDHKVSAFKEHFIEGSKREDNFHEVQ
jgi:hypothetical protein